MSIRTKLLIACLLLVAVNGSVGVFFQRSQQRMAALGIDIYDRGFMAMSYLRSSQNALLKLRSAVDRMPEQGDAAPGKAPDTDEEAGSASLGSLAAALPDILGDVQVAHDRAMSPEGEQAASGLANQLQRLDALFRAHDLGAVRTHLEEAQGAFDAAVEVYAGDGYLYRRNVQRLMDGSVREIGIALALSVATALLITLILAATIVPPLRQAVRIARAISGGKLDNDVSTRGSGETGTLLKALALMQANLVEKIGRIDALAIDAETRAAELSVQNGRFEAALDNMRHGLCMVDGGRRLIVANRRYMEMFGPPQLGSDAAAWPLFPQLGAAFDGLASVVEHLPDGRVIRIACQSVREGGWVITFEDVTERHLAETQLRDMARTDALTGLPNRLLFMERLQLMLQDVGRPPGPTVLYIDLDGFKNVNDTFGHGVGDDLLRSVAERLQGRLGSAELIARLGGDEFAVILKSGDQRVIEARARDLIDCLRLPFDLALQRVSIGASIGIAIRRAGAGSDDTDPSTVLLKNADLALYRAKGEGKGTFRLHSEALEAAFLARRTLEVDLANALERREFILAFQPIVAANGGRVRAFEALLRWHHPQQGIIPPDVFIPVAEEIGLIAALGQWVLRTACAEAAKWPSDVKVAVNLSPLQFRQGFLAADVRRSLAEAQLAPQRLELEITESVLLHDDESVLAILFQLRELGVSISLDDFGTGYSSLSYLRKFPFDKLKIDRSFVENLSNPETVAILQAMLHIGRALNVTVVAEGIETDEQAERFATRRLHGVPGLSVRATRPGRFGAGRHPQGGRRIGVCDGVGGLSR